ncbi:MAG TPA: DivIVA domain-containing protein [Bacillota bacterium]|nr:DivIVA domain-containing protein [Bacillota bacterium]
MLAPHELKNKSFSKTVRGYNPIEVDEYIDFLVEKYTEIYRENSELEKKLKSVAAKLDQMRAEEESIRTTLINAQKMAERIVNDASARADIITDSIKERSDTIIAQFRDQISDEKDEMWEIRTRILDFKKRVFDLYREHIESLQSLSVNEIEDIVLPDEDKLVAGIFNDIKTAVKTEEEHTSVVPDPIPPVEMDKLRQQPEPESAPKEAPAVQAAEEPEDKKEDTGDDFIKKLEGTKE